MSSQIKIKRSSVLGNSPTFGTEIVEGELALNTADQKLYSANSTATFTLADLSSAITASSGADNRVAVFTSGTDIEGDSNFTWDGSILDVNGKVDITDTNTNQLLNVVLTDTVQDVDRNAAFIQNDISGTGGTTGDRSKIALRLDVNNSATGSTLVSGQRLYNRGIYNTQDNTGDLYVNTGLYNLITSGTAANTINQYGTQSISRSTLSGVITNNYGTYTESQLRGSGDITYNYGAFNRAIWYEASSGNTTSGIGAYNNIYTSAGSTSTITTVRGTYTVIDLDDGTIGTVYAHHSIIDVENAADVTGSAYMYYGAYPAGSTANIDGTSWGVYLTGEETNYFSGNVGIGTTTPTSNLDVTGNITASTIVTGVEGIIGGGTGSVAYTSLNQIIAKGTGNSGIVIDSGTTSLGRVAFGDGALAGYVEYSHSDNSMRFSASAAERMRITSTATTIYGDIVPDTDNTGNVGTAALTWNNGQFTDLTVNTNLKVNGLKDTSGDLGISGQILSSTATGTNWINAPIPGTGTVTASNTPVDGEIAVFTSGTDIEGDSNFTWDGSILDVNGKVDIADTNTNRPLTVILTDTVQDVTHDAALIRNNISGTGGTTGDRIKSALRLESDNSATGSTLVSGQRLYYRGIYNIQDNTGDLYDQRGIYNVTTTETAANTYLQYGIVNISRTTSSGVITSNYGTYSDSQLTGSGDITNNYAVWNRAIWNSTSSGNTTSGIGAYNSIRTVAGSTSTITTVRGTYTVIDLDDSTIGTVYAHDSTIVVENDADVTGSAYLYYGLYAAGTTVNIGATSWGIYLTGEDKSYFSNDVGIGTTTPSTLLDIEGDNTPDPLHVVRGGTVTSDQVGIKLTGTNSRWIGKGTDDNPYWATTNDISTGDKILVSSDTFGGDVSGTYDAIVVTNDSHTHTFDNLTGKTLGTGDYSTAAAIQSGRGSGGVALTINDGYGNANVTWNHKSGIPEQTGRAARIEVNTDEQTVDAFMSFELGNATASTPVTLTTALKLSTTATTIYGDLVPDTDNTGNVGTAALTWNNGQFTNLTIDTALTVNGLKDSSGDLGISGQILSSTATGTNWINAPIPGTGTVTSSNTPVNGEIAVFTSGTDIEGDTNFTWDGSILDVNGKVDITDTNTNRPLNVILTDTVQDVDRNTALIQNDISGTGGTTGDRFKSTLRVDGNNSATGSTLVSGQRLYSYGIYNTQDNTGYLNSHRGLQSTTTTGTAATTYTQYGINNTSRNTSSGVITYNYGTVTDSQLTGSGDITYNYGTFSRVQWNSTSSGNTTSAYAAYNNVYTLAGSTSTITTVRGTHTVIDLDDSTIGTVFAHDSKIDVENAANVTGNAYMYYGIYSAGSTIGATSWGVYLTGEDKNYFSAAVGIGTTSPSTKLDVAGSVRSIPHNIGTLTAASTTINFDNGNHQYFTINTTSAFTFNNPSNADVGVIGTIRIERGASVPTDFLFGTAWKFPSPGTVPEIQSDLATSGDYGYLDYYVHGATDVRVTWSGKVGA